MTSENTLNQITSNQTSLEIKVVSTSSEVENKMSTIDFLSKNLRSFSVENNNPSLVFNLPSKEVGNQILELTKVKGVVGDKSLSVYSHNIIDMISFLLKSTRLYESFDSLNFDIQSIIRVYCGILNSGQVYPLNIKFHKTLPDAVSPSKTRFTDAGYDLTLVKEIERNGMYIKYDTGIVVDPPIGYYCEVFPRSSLTKTGHILGNSVGVIDSTYRGNIQIVLVKVDEKSPDITLPFRAVQLVLKKMEFNQMVEVSPSEIKSTDRNTGGFGSTG